MKGLPGSLGDLLIITVAGVLGMGFFIAFVAPGMPRTPWGWLLSLVLGVPLLLFVDVVFDLMGSGMSLRPRPRRRRGWLWWVGALVICIVVLTGFNALLSNVGFLSAQFR